MELNELVNQIAAKVAQRISDMEKKAGVDLLDSEGVIQKPKLMILSESHGTDCHELLENPILSDRYDIVCALTSEYTCDMEQFDVVILRNLSNTSLAKIAEGMTDTPFTELAVKAILLGKKLIIPNEEVELFQYRETAPKLYYGMMMQKIELLRNAGVCFCKVEQLEQVILNKECEYEKNNCCAVEEKSAGVLEDSSEKIAIKLEKRVVTERDIHSLYEQHAELIYVTKKTIITDLAREYAEQRGISFSIS